jgi:nicotinamidase-related amidase
VTIAENLIDRGSAALVVIDIQERLAAVMDRRDHVVAATSRLARAAAVVDIPIIVTRQYPKGLGGTVPELEEVLVDLAEQGASVTGLDKTAFCCAAEPDFNEELRATGRTQVVLAGMETHICVTQTALALEPQYQVHVAADAVCSRTSRDHDVALDRLRAANVIVTTSESVMYEAVGRAGTPEFKQLLEIVKE